ncbi:hypothetical protein Xoosp13_12 [Xanthomonas phage Xoo-sp13]|nr:hypothetical protein Xoosp13_12 [Xanthomonas phage Xoo-sp13]
MNKFIVMGIGVSAPFAGKVVYVDIDASSGGYPFWQDIITRAHLFDSAEHAVCGVDIEYMYRQATDIKVATIEYVTTPVKSVNYDMTRIEQEINDAKQSLELAMNNMKTAINTLNLTAQALAANEIKKYSAKLIDLSKREEMLRNITTN